jgi:hypothetical protein
MPTILGRAHQRTPTPTPPAAPTAPAPPAAPGPATPAMSFEDAIKQYQGSHPATTASYEAMFDYLKGQGYQVERPTHAGGRLPSDDKIVDSTTGRVYDLFINSDRLANGGTAAWTLGNSGYWVNGKPSSSPPGTAPGTTPPAGTPPGGAVGRTPTPGGTTTGDVAVPRGTIGLPPFPAAYEAARRQRLRGGVGGRGGTILGGFAAGTPRTRPATVIGR